MPTEEIRLATSGRAPTAWYRRKPIWTAAVATAGIVAGLVLARGSERYLRHRVSRELSKATGMSARVGAVGLQAQSGTLSDVRLSSDGREIHIDRVEVDADLKALLSGVEACVEVAEVGRVVVVLNGDRTASSSAASDEDGADRGRERQQGGTASDPEFSSSAAEIERLSRRAASVLARFLAPRGRVTLQEVVVRAGTGGPSAQETLLRTRGAVVERHGSGFVVETAAVVGNGGGDGGETLHAGTDPARSPDDDHRPSEMRSDLVEASLRFGDVSPEGRIQLHGVRLLPFARFLPELPWHDPERARLDGELAFELVPEGDAHDAIASRVGLSGNVTLRSASLYAPYLAERPIPMDVAVRGRAAWDGETLTLESSDFRVGRGRFEVTGTLSWADGLKVDMSTNVPGQACNDAMSVVPDAVLGELSAFEWSGRFGGKLRLRVDMADPSATLAEFRLDNGCRFERAPDIADVDRLAATFVHETTDDAGNEHVFESGPGSRDWVPISAVSPFLIHSVLAHEDATFFEHRGFASFAIETALRRNVSRGRMAYGASTVSMQLAKNLFLTRDKTLARKAREVFLTWWLESSLSKEQILELYLNVIEYGPGIYGLRRASRTYFGREPRDLSPGESVFLASLLPAPRSYFHQFRRGRLSAGTKRQMTFLLRHMHERGRIDQRAMQYGLQEVDSMDRDGTFGARRPISGNVGAAAMLPVGRSYSGAGRERRRLWWRWAERPSDDPDVSGAPDPRP